MFQSLTGTIKWKAKKDHRELSEHFCHLWVMEVNRGEHGEKNKKFKSILLLHGNLVSRTFSSDSPCGGLEDTDDQTDDLQTCKMFYRWSELPPRCFKSPLQVTRNQVTAPDLWSQMLWWNWSALSDQAGLVHFQVWRSSIQSTIPSNLVVSKLNFLQFLLMVLLPCYACRVLSNCASYA